MLDKLIKICNHELGQFAAMMFDHYTILEYNQAGYHKLKSNLHQLF